MPINKRLARLIDLVPYIAEHQGIAISELASKFGVTAEEIEKDLWLLYMCGLPGQTPLELMEFEFEDGYVTVRNADELKKPRSLTQTEIAALIVGLELLSAQGNKAASNLKEKLSNLLATKVSYAPARDDLWSSQISESIQRNKIIKIVYNGRERVVIPLEIYKKSGESYLRAFCKEASDRRTFKLSRISSLNVLDIHELAPNEVPTESSSLSTQIRTHHSARRVRESLGGTDEIKYYSSEWLISQVMALGGAVELADEQLRAQILVKLRASQSLYL
jgi:proteasome accessory factor C